MFGNLASVSDSFVCLFWVWTSSTAPHSCSSQVQTRCRAAEEEARGGDVLASTRCDCELSLSWSPSAHLSSGWDPSPPTVARTRRLFRSPSWPSPCQKSWRRGGSRRRARRPPSAAPGRRWRWTSTAPTPRRPSPSTTSTRAASSRHTSTCESNGCVLIPPRLKDAVCMRAAEDPTRTRGLF